MDERKTRFDALMSEVETGIGELGNLLTHWQSECQEARLQKIFYQSQYEKTAEQLRKFRKVGLLTLQAWINGEATDVMDGHIMELKALLMETGDWEEEYGDAGS